MYAGEQLRPAHKRRQGGEVAYLQSPSPPFFPVMYMWMSLLLDVSLEFFELFSPFWMFLG